MSNYTKEKNFIIINLDGVSGSYRLDINSGTYYGVKGQPLKSCPRKSEIVGLFPYYNTYNGTNLEYVAMRMFENCARVGEFANWASALVTADRLDSAGFPLLNLSRSQYKEIGKNFKEFTTYFKSLEAERFHFSHFASWLREQKALKALKAYGSIADGLTVEMYNALVDEMPSLTKEEIAISAYYLGRGKLWEYHCGYTAVRKLQDYFSLCEGMGKTPQKSNNFMREYCETKKEYELRKEEYDNAKIVANYAKHAKAWEFTYGDFTVVIPSCGTDIIDEGCNMHHCVGGYVQDVVKNKCYICFVRHKNSPNKCYLTCQVFPNGNIGQYFLAYDKLISSAEDRAFKDAFQAHLREVWGE